MKIRRGFAGATAIAVVAALGAGCEDELTDLGDLDGELVVEPKAVSFGDVALGESARTQVFLRNTGTAAMTLNVVPGDVFDASVYAWTLDVSTIPPSGVAVLDLTFGPEALGLVPSELTIETDSRRTPSANLPIEGRGVSSSLSVEPQQLDFRNVVVGTTKSLPITLTNTSGTEADVEYIDGNGVRRCSDPGPAAFCVRFRDVAADANGRFQLAPGDSAQADVQFSPTVAGVRSDGNFTLKPCASAACEVRVGLTGTGVEAGLRCSPGRLDFGQVNPGERATRTVTCENIANAAVTVLNWSASSEGGAFSAEASAPQVLAEGESVTIETAFEPVALGRQVGRLRVETDDPNPALRVLELSLEGSGGGPEIEVLPARLDFGEVALIAPARRRIVIANLGFAPLIVSSIDADVLGTASFTAPGAGPVVLQPGETETVVVEFEPRLEGEIGSALRITSNDADEGTIEIPLRGLGVNLPPCTFSVQPPLLNFGAVQVTRSLRRSFRILNEGRSDCLVTSVALISTSTRAFSLPEGNQIVSRRIAAGQAMTVPVEFAPQVSGREAGQIEVGISSPTRPFNTVDVSGVGVAEALLVVPREVDFGTIGVGCATRARAITLYNTGSTPVSIDAVALDGGGSDFSIVSLPMGLPSQSFDLTAGQSTEIEVRFRAAAESEYSAAVRIETSGPSGSVDYYASLDGRGSLDATQRDEFAQLGRPIVDILFVVDKTTSMTQEQDSLAANFSAFLQFAEAQALDYHIASTTTNTNPAGGNRNEVGRITSAPAGTMRQSSVTGPVGNRIVTPRTSPSPAAVFAANVSYQLTGGPPNEESGLRGAELAFSAPAITGQNAAFLRPAAVLSLIFVSDAQDHSPQPVDYYVNFYRAIKGFRNTNLFTASAVAAPSVPGSTRGTCSGPGGSAYSSGRYEAVVTRTGGVFVSICTADWSRALEDLSQTAFGFKSRFFLTNQPEQGTLRVFIDGVELDRTTSGGGVNWAYDLPSNSINFASYATPEPGSQIRVEYTAECL